MILITTTIIDITMNICELCKRSAFMIDENRICSSCSDWYELDCDIEDCCEDKYQMCKLRDENSLNTKTKYYHLFSTTICLLGNLGEVWWKIAAKHGKLAIISWLHNNNINGLSMNIVQIALENKHFDIVDWIYKNTKI
jgi:hypothetical protein